MKNDLLKPDSVQGNIFDGYECDCDNEGTRMKYICAFTQKTSCNRRFSISKLFYKVDQNF